MSGSENLGSLSLDEILLQPLSVWYGLVLKATHLVNTTIILLLLPGKYKIFTVALIVNVESRFEFKLSGSKVATPTLF